MARGSCASGTREQSDQTEALLLACKQDFDEDEDDENDEDDDEDDDEDEDEDDDQPGVYVLLAISASHGLSSHHHLQIKLNRELHPIIGRRPRLWLISGFLQKVCDH